MPQRQGSTYTRTTSLLDSIVILSSPEMGTCEDIDTNYCSICLAET